MPGKTKPKRGCLRVFCIVVLLGIILIILGEQNLSQTLLDMAYARAYSMAVETVNRAVRQVLTGELDYHDLIDVTMDGGGKVAMLRANTIRMNEIATGAALVAEEELNSIENQLIPVPLGSALGVKFLAGFGPRINVQIIPIGAVNAGFETEFESAGINQTRHKIFLSLRTTVSLIIPTGSRKVEVLSTVPIAENIIVGQVPESFVDVSDQDDMLNLIP